MEMYLGEIGDMVQPNVVQEDIFASGVVMLGLSVHCCDELSMTETHSLSVSGASRGQHQNSQFASSLAASTP